jgi:hypothetical protein
MPVPSSSPHAGFSRGALFWELFSVTLPAIYCFFLAFFYLMAVALSLTCGSFSYSPLTKQFSTARRHCINSLVE